MCRDAPRARSPLARRGDPRASVPRTRSSGCSSRTSRGAVSGASSAVEEKGLTAPSATSGANLVPSGTGVVGARADRGPKRAADDRRRGAGAVGELWEAIRQTAAARRSTIGPASRCSCIDRPPARAGTGLRPATLDDLDAARPRLRGGVPRGGRDRRAMPATRTCSAGGRGARSSSGAAGSGSRTAGFASRPRRRPGRRQAVQLQQVWVDPALRGRGYAKRGACRPLRRCCSRGYRACACSHVPRTHRPCALYDSIGMQPHDHLPLADLSLIVERAVVLPARADPERGQQADRDRDAEAR